MIRTKEDEAQKDLETKAKEFEVEPENSAERLQTVVVALEEKLGTLKREENELLAMAKIAATNSQELQGYISEAKLLDQELEMTGEFRSSLSPHWRNSISFPNSVRRP